MTILGVDYGQKRVGVAITDTEEIISSPLMTLAVTSPDDAVRRVALVAELRRAGLIVVGMPYNMDGSVGPKAQETAAFVESLRRAVTCEVRTWDERLTTFAAEDAMLEAGLTRNKRRKRIDKVAAQMILRSFIEARRRGEDSP